MSNTIHMANRADIPVVGVFNAAHEKGVKSLDDVSLIGYDDIHISKFISPSLTTIHQPKYRLGKPPLKLYFED